MARPKRQETAAIVAPEASPLVYKRDNPEQITVASQIAGGALYCRFFKFKNAAEHFPIEPQMRHVDKFFQFCKDGPLYVDEPKSAKDVENCQRKAEVMRKEGLRYVYITKEMTIDDALEQLAFNRGAA